MRLEKNTRISHEKSMFSKTTFLRMISARCIAPIAPRRRIRKELEKFFQYSSTPEIFSDNLYV